MKNTRTYKKNIYIKNRGQDERQVALIINLQQVIVHKKVIKIETENSKQNKI